MCLERAVESLGVGLGVNQSLEMGIGVPVVRGNDLSSYAHQTVVVAGKVESVRGDLLTLSGAGGVSIQVQKNPGTTVTSTYVLVKAVVVPDAPLREMEIYSFGDNFDLDTYAEMTDMCNNPAFKALFS